MHNEVVSAFWSRHGIVPPQCAVLTEPAIIALDSAHEIFASAFGNAPEPKETSGLIRCAFENISNRLYEQAAGMLVCLGTGSAAAAETIARTVIEAAFNFQFIASKNHEARLFAFFHQYLQEHGRKLDEWQKLEETKSFTPKQAEILKAISERRSAHAAMENFVRSLGTGFGYDHPEAVSQFWPTSLFKRCEQLDKASDYLTSYHRLSASSHVNAEETIRWLFGIYHAAARQDQGIRERLSVETISFSAMMTRVAVLQYIEATHESCRALNAKCDAQELVKTSQILFESIEEIAPFAGIPG